MVKRNRFSSPLVLIGLLFGAALLLPACSDNDDPMGSNDQIDLEPFKAMARADPEWDLKNRLSLIDDELVFWDRRRTCCDYTYHETLFGETPEQILCDSYQIAGPVPLMECPDPRYRDAFDTIIQNLDEPDLGLGNDHEVELVFGDR